MARARHAPEEKEGAARIAARVGAALLGNYALTLGLASLIAVILVLAGMQRPEAAALTSILAFLFFLVVLLYSFHTRRLARAWAAMIVAGPACWYLAHWLAEGRL